MPACEPTEKIHPTEHLLWDSLGPGFDNWLLQLFWAKLWWKQTKPPVPIRFCQFFQFLFRKSYMGCRTLPASTLAIVVAAKWRRASTSFPKHNFELLEEIFEKTFWIAFQPYIFTFFTKIFEIPERVLTAAGGRNALGSPFCFNLFCKTLCPCKLINLNKIIRSSLFQLSFGNENCKLVPEFWSKIGGDKFDGSSEN